MPVNGPQPAEDGRARCAANRTKSTWSNAGAAVGTPATHRTTRATFRSPIDGRACGARRGTGSHVAIVGGAAASVRSVDLRGFLQDIALPHLPALPAFELPDEVREQPHGDRKSTRLNSSHGSI